jgi:guanosine-3',5'-bis(diphosphate) 3'-pyrophosphohydrolase
MTDSVKLVNAINFAAAKHINQRRKNHAKSPYINHPIEVMTLLANAGVTDVEILMSAVLHDTIEDTDATYGEIGALFGFKVATIVKECSDDKELGKVERKKLQIEHAETISDAAKLVKMSDKLSNMRDLMTNPPTNWTKKEIDGYVVWSYFVVDKLKGSKGLNTILEKQLDYIFDSFGVLKIDSAERSSMLKDYYSHIDNSE